MCSGTWLSSSNACFETMCEYTVLYTSTDSRKMDIPTRPRTLMRTSQFVQIRPSGRPALKPTCVKFLTPHTADRVPILFYPICAGDLDSVILDQISTACARAYLRLLNGASCLFPLLRILVRAPVKRCLVSCHTKL